ncbi:MAG: MFS transporter [Jatrophihabitans endophyticus]|nr:MFS transporter [Jatrophihabitans endophyticus]
MVAALTAVWLLQSAAAGAMLPFIVIWAHRVVDLGGPSAGVLFVVQAVGEFAAGLAAGSLADRVGHRRLLVVSTAGMVVGYGLLGVATAPVPAIALFLLAGVFESAFHPNVFALIGDTVADDDLPRAFSVVRIGANVGGVLGPLLGAAAALASLRAVFGVTGGLLVLAVVAECVLIPRTVVSQPDDDDEPEIPPGTLRALRTDGRLALLVLVGGVLSIAFTWWEADGLVLLRRQHALGASAYAALFTIGAVAVIAFQLPVTRLIRDLSTRAALAIGVLVQAAGLAVLLLAGLGYAVLVVAVVLMSAGQMIYGPTLQTFVTRRAGPRRQASYQASLSITEDVGTAVGPVTGLALGAAFGSVAVWCVGALACAGAGVVARLAASSESEPESDEVPAARAARS